MIAIIEYGMGDAGAVRSAFELVGAEAVVTCDPMAVKLADGVVLAGEGMFGDGMAQLEARGLVLPICQVISAGKPLLGFGVGLHLLFRQSDEDCGQDGLGAFPGTVRRLPDQPGLPVPHVGWSPLSVCVPSSLLAGMPNHSRAYFEHSYYVEPRDAAVTVATVDYGLKFAAAVERGNVLAVQFRPDKSGEVGNLVLRNFALLCL